MRNQFYKTTLNFEMGHTLPITIACKGIEKVPELIERNRVVYEKTQAMFMKIKGTLRLESFVVNASLPTIQMDEEKYQEEMSYCDIVED